MATHILEELHSYSAAITRWERNVGNHNVDQASVVVSGTAPSPQRRYEARMDYRRMCSYEVVEASGGRSVVTGQGEALAVNRSTDGILLLTALVPHAKQLIEVHTPRFGWGRTCLLYTSPSPRD